MVFYYEDYGYNDDLIPMGHVESGIEFLAGMGDEFTVTMERVEETASMYEGDQDGLIRMGRITSDLSMFDTLGESAEVLIEIAE